MLIFINVSIHVIHGRSALEENEQFKKKKEVFFMSELRELGPRAIKVRRAHF